MKKAAGGDRRGLFNESRKARGLPALLAALCLLLAALGFRLLLGCLPRGLPLRGACLLLTLLTADGSLGTRYVSVTVDEVDVVRVHVESAVGNLFGAAFRNPGLLSLNFPNPSVLHVVHEVLLARHSQLCDFLRHLGSPPSESCYRKSAVIVSGAMILSRGYPGGSPTEQACFRRFFQPRERFFGLPWCTVPRRARKMCCSVGATSGRPSNPPQLAISSRPLAPSSRLMSPGSSRRWTRSTVRSAPARRWPAPTVR